MQRIVKSIRTFTGNMRKKRNLFRFFVRLLFLSTLLVFALLLITRSSKTPVASVYVMHGLDASQLADWPRESLALECLPRIARLSSISSLSSYKWAQISVTQGANFHLLVHSSNDIVSTSLLKSGYWEADHVEAIEMYHTGKGLSLPSRKRYIDVGGNLGYFSLLAASKGYDVTTVEAMKENAYLFNVSLCANPALAKRVNLHHTAVGAESRECFIVSESNNKADGHINCDLKDSRELMSGYEIRGKGSITTLSDILSEDFFIMKMDIEGHEPPALRGAREYFTKNMIQYIITESHRTPARVDYFRALASLHYSIRPVDYSKTGAALVSSAALIDVEDGLAVEKLSEMDFFCERIETK